MVVLDKPIGLTLAPDPLTGQVRWRMTRVCHVCVCVCARVYGSVCVLVL
jgi:hypothetical protein